MVNSLDSWQPGWTGLEQSPALAVPETIAELQELVKASHREGRALIPWGSGSKISWGGLVDKIDLALGLGRLDRLIDHAAGDMTATVEAGMTLDRLQEILAGAGQFLPVGPGFKGTLGGLIATGLAGSWRHRYGGIRDLLLGISFIRADGELAKAGGRVVKNVAGYDLMKLLTGSYGTLAIITEVTLRVYPRPEASRTLLITGSAEAIAPLSQRFSPLTPTSLDLLSPALVETLGEERNFGILVRYQGIAASTDQQTEQTKVIADSLKITTYQETAEVGLWQKIADHLWQPRPNPALFCKLGMLPTQAVDFMGQLEPISSNALALIHLGSGVGWLSLPVVRTTAIAALRQWCHQSSGYLSVLVAPTQFKQQLEVWGYQGNALGLMKKLKNQFDPQNTLSPGRFVVG